MDRHIKSLSHHVNLFISLKSRGNIRDSTKRLASGDKTVQATKDIYVYTLAYRRIILRLSSQFTKMKRIKKRFIGHVIGHIRFVAHLLCKKKKKTDNIL
jgi:hypothetical protein